MATITISEKYRCSDDCLQSGCPSHTATLTYQSTADCYTFQNGKGQKYHFERGELESFISMMKKLGERRFDAIQL